MKIAAYCRVSTEKEAQIDSLEKQIEFFNEFTKKNGYELYKLYADEGISGKQIKHRKQFQQMMIDAKAKKFDKVVVKDVSRFARNTVDLLQSVRELKSYGVQVDFLNNGEVMEGGSEFILTILGAMAQQESANMSKRVKFGKDITAKKGRVPNLVFGYDKIPDERYTLKINEEEAKIVKEIFESYVYKGIGTTKIAWNLNDRGIRTKKTKSKWVQTSIVRMLKNPIYTGRVTNKKSEVTDFITGTRKAVLIFKESMGLFWYDRYKAIVEAVLNLVISIVLAMKLGVAGIFLGTFMSTVLTSLWIEPYVLYKHSFHKYPMRFFARYACNMLIMAFVWWCTHYCCMLVSASPLLNLLFRFLVCMSIPNLLLWLIYRKTSEWQDTVLVLERMRQKLEKKAGIRVS